MHYKYYKCAEDNQTIVGLIAEWKRQREAQNEELAEIFASHPYAEGWIGGDEYISAIKSSAKNPHLKKLKGVKGYRVIVHDGLYVSIRPDKRYKAGKELAKVFERIDQVLNATPSIQKFIVRELDIHCRVIDFQYHYSTSVGLRNGYFLVRIPVRDVNDGGYDVPQIPDFLTEINEKEFRDIAERDI